MLYYRTMKNRLWLILLLVPLVAYCSTLVNTNQISWPLVSGLLTSSATGQLSVSTIGAGLQLVGGVLSVQAPVTNAPAITVTTVTAATPNAFPVPAGKSTCLVTRNVAQSQGVDYLINSSSQVVFNPVPAVGDVVQLACW